MSENLVKMPNPLTTIVESTAVLKVGAYRGANRGCQYKDNGCTWVITELADADVHHSECKFRPSRCVGAQLGVWK